MKEKNYLKNNYLPSHYITPRVLPNESISCFVKYKKVLPADATIFIKHGNNIEVEWIGNLIEGKAYYRRNGLSYVNIKNILDDEFFSFGCKYKGTLEGEIKGGISLVIDFLSKGKSLYDVRLNTPVIKPLLR
jgi:hypothetical protein